MFKGGKKEEQLRGLLDHMDVQCWTLEDAETYGYVNKAHATFLGFKKEDLCDRSIKEVLSEPEASFCIESNRLVVRRGERTKAQHWVRNAQGELRLMSVDKEPIMENGEVKYILCKSKDITQEHSKSIITQQQYKDVVETQSNLVYRFTPDLIITFVNSTYCEHFAKGCTKTLIGKSFLSHVPEEEHQHIRDYIKTFSKEENIKSHSHTVVHEDGVKSYIRWYDRAFYDEVGKIIEFQSIGVDITQLRELEDKINKKEENLTSIKKSLIESNRRYQDLIHLIPESVAIHEKGKILYVNKAMLDMMGIEDHGEIEGHHVFEFIHESDHQKAKEHAKYIEQDNQYPILEYRFRGKDKKVVYGEAAVSQITYQGKSCMINIIRDISEKRKHDHLIQVIEAEEELLKQAQEHDRLRTEFFANISHELRTPLNLILSTVQLLEFHSLNGEGKENSKYIKILKQNCFRLLKLINNLIDITKIDSGYVDTKLGNYDIIDIIDKLMESSMPYIRSKGLHLEYLTEVASKEIACDPEMVERIILNILSNAVKFTNEDGLITIKVKENIEYVEIAIEDTGIGIAPQHHGIIFERFRQIDKSFTRNHEGSGIGLALTKALVEIQKGIIKIESEQGKGSRFTISLPNRTIKEGRKEGLQRERLNNQFYGSSRTVETINVEFSDL